MPDTASDTIIVITWASLNLVTFVLFGLDKHKARQQQRRISERALLSWSYLGGAFGGWCAMFSFRHKTQKPSFFLPMALAGAAHGALAYWWVTRQLG